ncbi:hypothetical protein T492DRAFT_875230 [Pavlovales sp. CCMP2436]|nr:hypothetical protein T492DRAFT_875230 [Pavlovales sp. CCMP2436]
MDHLRLPAMESGREGRKSGGGRLKGIGPFTLSSKKRRESREVAKEEVGEPPAPPSLGPAGLREGGDVEALLLPASGGRKRRRWCCQCLGLCCVVSVVLVGLLAWAAHVALGKAMSLVCLGVSVVSVQMESLCENPFVIRAELETYSPSLVSVAFSDLTIGMRASKATRGGLRATVVGTHAIGLGTSSHAITVLISLDEEEQIEGMLQLISDGIICMSIPSSAEKAANCSAEMTALAETTHLNFDAEARQQMHDVIQTVSWT